jgi:tetratricopeptide (TPR) repeat protein
MLLCGVVAVLLIALGAVHAEPRRAPTIEPRRAEQDFVAANELALKGDLRAAIDLYQTLLDQGVYHEDLLYNLGNAYAQDGQLVQAIICYERALRLAPNDRDARANLDALRKKIAARTEKLSGDKALAEDKVAIADVIEPLVAQFSLPTATYAGLAADAILFFCLLLRRRSSSNAARRRLGWLAIPSLLVLVASVSVVAGYGLVARDPRAVVVETTELKEGPNTRFKASAHVPGGMRVRVMAEDGGWVQVLRQDGTSGWVEAKSLVRV